MDAAGLLAGTAWLEEHLKMLWNIVLWMPLALALAQMFSDDARVEITCFPRNGGLSGGQQKETPTTGRPVACHTKSAYSCSVSELPDSFRKPKSRSE